jgi:uncharacterized protein (DUF1697 family)
VATIFVALLRSVNVAGRNRVAMADLRALVASLGFDDVTTYVQSGNVVFSGPGTAEGAAASIREALTADLGVDVPVLARTGQEFAGVLSVSPYQDLDADPATLHVTFLGATPEVDAVDGLHSDALAQAPDRLQVIGAEVFLHCPGGYGRTKLTNTYLERRLGVTATTRNWRTVTVLAEMVGAGAG